TILLPTGSEPDADEIQVLDSALRSRAEAQGSGQIQNFVATVRSTVDLRAVPAGASHLAVRRTGEDWSCSRRASHEALCSDTARGATTMSRRSVYSYS